MKKFLLVISLAVILLLAVGAAGAADAGNASDSPSISIAGDDADNLEMTQTDNENQNAIDDLDDENVLSDTGKETPKVDVDDVTSFEGENITIPFNVTDSKGVPISGDVNVTLAGESESVSKIVRIDNGSGHYSMSDLIEIIKDNKLNASDIQFILNSINATGGNMSEIISGLNEAYSGLNISIPMLISGMSDLMNGSDVDVKRLMDGLAMIAKAVNTTLLIDGLDDIVNVSSFNFTTLSMICSAVIGGFDLDYADIIAKLSKGISVDGSKMIEGLKILNDELGLFKGKSVIDIIKGLGLKLSASLTIKVAALLIKKPVYFSEVFALFNEILDYNHMTYLQVIEKVWAQRTENDFIHRLITSNTTRANVANGISKVVNAVRLDSAVADSVIKYILEKPYNSSKVIAEIAEITGINMSAPFNSSTAIGGLSKIIAALGVNESGLIEGASKIMSSFKFNIPNAQKGISEIQGSVSINDSMLTDGLDKTAEGLGIDVSAVAGKIISKYGYFATFTGTLAPGLYNISVEYLSNDKYNSARNDASKLTVLKKNESRITADAKVDGQTVSISGSVASNATGIVLLEIGEDAVFTPVIKGAFSYEGTLKPGDYNVNVIYLGNLQYCKSNTTVSFTVKNPTAIISSGVSTTYGTGTNLVITLKDSAGNVVVGKQITENLNGKTYGGKTNSNGQVSIAVPSTLLPKTYTASISFAGDDKYVKSTGTAKVTVSKAKSKIIAKNKSFKVKTKTKKYTITLKNNKGKAIKSAKVTIKVKGKTYTAKTNSKGKATFKINKLTAKGKFKATVKFAGNKYYKSVTKKVQITVKK